ncbi:MAG: 5'/3'-nucleotidase SurE [Burkholderiales bacterium]|nr:5'/3'-nucleotidase SurE [Burkholderiales bacterium]
MRILLTNDDSYLATGIRKVFNALVNAGHDVIMIAPEHNSSGAGHSIAVYNPISITKVEEKIYFVSSTPADSVRLGLQEVYGSYYPDLVISGVNHGENLGEDIFYSGTVGAAREGALHGIRSLAFSMNILKDSQDRFKHLDTAAKVVVDLVHKIENKSNSLPSSFVWNINIPNKPYNELNGYVSARVGLRPQHEPLIKQETPRMTTIYWQGFSSRLNEYSEGTDLDLFVNYNKITITPLELLPTNHQELSLINAII